MGLLDRHRLPALDPAADLTRSTVGRRWAGSGDVEADVQPGLIVWVINPTPQAHLAIAMWEGRDWSRSAVAAGGEWLYGATFLSVAVLFAISVVRANAGTACSVKGATGGNQEISRRTLLKGGGAAIAGLGAVQVAGPAHAFPGDPAGRLSRGWTSLRRAPFPDTSLLKWEELDSFLTPPTSSSSSATTAIPPWTRRLGGLRIGGLVAQPQSLSLADLKAPPASRSDVHAGVLGQPRLPVLHRRRSGTPAGRARRWRRCCSGPGSCDEGTEVVFWGADSGRVTIRDNSGVVRSHPAEPASPLPTDIDLTITEQFARSMSLDEALSGDNLLCYEMNGAPLPRGARVPAAPDRARVVRRGQREVADAHRGDRPALRGPLHGARLRDHPRAGARRPDRLDVQHRQATTG